MAGNACRCRRPSPPCPPDARRPQRLDRFPADISEWLEVQGERSVLPEPHQLLVETFPHEGHHLGRLQLRRLERAPVARNADHPAHGEAGLKPMSLSPRPRARLLWASADHRPQILVLARHPRTRVHRLGRKLLPAQDRVPRSGGDRRAGRPPPPQQEEVGRQVSFRPTSSTTAAPHEPEQRLLRAAWDDARRRITELGGLVRLVDRTSATMLMSSSGDYADGGAADGHRRPRSAAAGRRGGRSAVDAGRKRFAEAAIQLVRSSTCPTASAELCKVSRVMNRLLLLDRGGPFSLSGCVVGTVARAGGGCPSRFPVKVASAGVDAATTSQAEADEKRGREMRKPG